MPDPRLAALAAIVRPQKVLPTTVEFVDIAGLVAGASQGEGLGNKFLAHIREVDAIAHVVRCFDDDDVVHVAGRVDPARDVAIINTELALADLDTVERARQRAEKPARAGDRDAQRWCESLERIRATLDRSEPVRSLRPDEFERERLRELHLLTAKPVLYVANVAEKGFGDNPHLDAARDFRAELAEIVPVCAAIEAETRARRCDRAFADLGPAKLCLHRIIRAIACRCRPTSRQVRRKCAPSCRPSDGAAGGRRDPHRFSSAASSGPRRLPMTTIAGRGEAGAREAGRLRLEGRLRRPRGDVMHFRFKF